jgi:hypothetical protein
MADDASTNCYVCIDFDYLCTSGILEVYISHPKDFDYSTQLAPAGPSPAPGPALVNEAGAHIMAMWPSQQSYPWLIELMDSAFYHYHYRIHEGRLHCQLSAAEQHASDCSLNSAPGWIGWW